MIEITVIDVFIAGIAEPIAIGVGVAERPLAFGVSLQLSVASSVVSPSRVVSQTSQRPAVVEAVGLSSPSESIA